MNELEVFYSDLYDGSTCVDMGSFSSFISDLNEILSLVEEKKNVCEGKLGYGECYNTLQTFQKNKSPGNDGLRTFALIVSAQLFCASQVSVACASSRGPREEKCHAKVCKQIWRLRRKVKKEVKVGDS